MFYGLSSSSEIRLGMQSKIIFLALFLRLYTVLELTRCFY